MLIKRRSQLTGVVRQIDLPVTEQQLVAFAAGALVQEAFPHLTLDQREFIMTGITAEEWDEAFSEIDGELLDDNNAPAF